MTELLKWKCIRAGVYTATDETGSYWHIEQDGHSRWEIYRDGERIYPDADALRYAKLYVESDLRKFRKESVNLLEP